MSASTINASKSHIEISGVYPHLCTYTFEEGETVPKLNETGIGAVAPWAGRLYMITYGAHFPNGSTHKLYSIDKDLNMTIHPESVGGTPAGRMIHKESDQLLLGHYLIDAEGNVRVISPKDMPARVTAIARHLDHPESKAYVIDMEGMIYEIDVNTMAVTKLFHKPVPGWHSKGGYTSQGRLVVSNNGEHGEGKTSDLQVQDLPANPANAGVLAQWDGKKWEIVERRQFTDVTGPGGIYGAPDDSSPLWSIGWDRRSLRLKLLDNGKWYTFLLPKAAHNNDPKHGWFTEWPRIREIGGGRMMMDMHGMFYQFPKTFSAANTAGLAPISSHLRYVPDFCDWNGRLVIATDEASVMGHKHCGQPQSNLWFGKFEDLKKWGPASGYGGPWVNDEISANTWSDPFLVAEFDRRILHLAAKPNTSVRIQLDEDGTGNWTDSKTVDVEDYATVVLPKEFKAEWIRLSSEKDCTATAYFHCTEADFQKTNRKLFAGLADLNSESISGLLYPRNSNRNLDVLGCNDESCFELTRDFKFVPSTDAKSHREQLAVKKVFEVDEGSVIVSDGTTRYRLPKGNAAFDEPFEFGWPRSVRELESERNLANIHGTFYEVPRNGYKADPDWERMRPVSSHRKQIADYCTWQGLLVLSGVDKSVGEDGHVFRAESGAAVWCGAIDDLWQLGKPIGQGGPWKETDVGAGVPSDAYLMTGYDHKTLCLLANQDTTVTVEVNVDHQTGWHVYKTFNLKAGKEEKYSFPQDYSAHWIRFTADTNCRATAWMIYE